MLAVYSQRPRNWREEEVEALAALAGTASAVLSNAELYQRVAMERERSYAILANIADGIVAVDREGKVVLWNQAAEQITAVPAAAALGRTPVEVLQRELASEEQGHTGERLVSVQRGGEEAWLSLTEAVMRDPVGAVSGRIFAFRDVSAERIVEQMKSDFVSTVSHELRAPLTSIYGFAETLLRRDVLFGEPERQTFLGYIASEAQRLTSIVDTLLGVARLEAGDLQVELVPTDLRTVVSEVVTSVRQTGGVNGHQLRARSARRAARRLGRPREAEPDPDEPARQRGQVLAGRRHGHRRGAPPQRPRRGARRRRGPGDPRSRARADLLEVPPDRERRGPRAAPASASSSRAAWSPPWAAGSGSTPWKAEARASPSSCLLPRTEQQPKRV